MKVHVHGMCALLALLAMVGCRVADARLDSYPEGKLETEADATQWAVRSSGPRVYASSTQVFSIVGVTGDSASSEKICPKETQSGNTLTVQGNCTDSTGRKWSGRLRKESEAVGSYTGKFVYEDFGYEDTTECGGKQVARKIIFKGIVDITGPEEERKFDVDVVVDREGPEEETCAVKKGSSAWDYEGTIKDFGKDLQTWSGSGRVGESDLGVVFAETSEERLDSRTCVNEASSGSTTIKAGKDTVVITYDGATDCEEPPTVQWSLNGTAKGELVGVACSAPGGASAGWIVSALCAAALLRRRRRS